MNQHDRDIMELGLRVKNEIWAENHGPLQEASTRLAIWRRARHAKRTAQFRSVGPVEFVTDWAGPGFTRKNDESADATDSL